VLARAIKCKGARDFPSHGAGGRLLRQTPAVHRGHQQILEYREILERPRSGCERPIPADAALMWLAAVNGCTVQAYFTCIVQPSRDQVKSVSCRPRSGQESKRLALGDRQIDIRPPRMTEPEAFARA